MLTVCPCAGPVSVSVVTFSVRVLVNTLLSVISAVSVPPLLETATGAVCAWPVKLAPSIVGFVLNTALPVPVSSVYALAKFALLGVPRNV